jgi:hypothetical protein
MSKRFFTSMPFKSLILSVCLLFAQGLGAATYTFLGTTDTDYYTNSNWAGNQAPPAAIPTGDVVVINANCNLPGYNINSWAAGSTLTINGGYTLTLAPEPYGMTCSGAINVQGNLVVNRAMYISNSGVLYISSTGQVTINEACYLTAAATINNSGIFKANGYQPMNGVFNNESGGSVTVNSGRRITIGGATFLNEASATVTNNGSILNVGTWTNNGSYLGSGAFTNGMFSSSGTVAPGASPGCMTFGAGINISGTLQMEINGETACSGFDRLTVTGTATLAGSLALSISHTPAANTTLTIIDAGSLSGTFASITGLQSGWTINYNTTSGNVELIYDAAAPVELIDFQAHINNSDIQLQWATATEYNNRGFEVEHSTDGLRWEILDFVAAKQQQAGTGASYAYLHTPAGKGAHYYRLRQIDIDGTITRSKVVYLMAQNREIRVFPTLSRGEINIQCAEESTIQVSVFNAQGQLQFSTQSKTADLGALPDGMYLIVVEADGLRVVERIWKG